MLFSSHNPTSEVSLHPLTTRYYHNRYYHTLFVNRCCQHSSGGTTWHNRHSPVERSPTSTKNDRPSLENSPTSNKTTIRPSRDHSPTSNTSSKKLKPDRPSIEKSVRSSFDMETIINNLVHSSRNSAKNSARDLDRDGLGASRRGSRGSRAGSDKGSFREGRSGNWGLKAGFKSFRAVIAGDDLSSHSEHHQYSHPQYQQQRPSDAKYLIVDIIDEAESAEVAHGRKLSNDDDQRDRCGCQIVITHCTTHDHVNTHDTYTL